MKLTIDQIQPEKLETVTWLLRELNDPFAVFPLQDVARSMGESIADSEDEFNRLSGPFGISRKYWDVPMEILDSGIGVAIGSVFVLGQAVITQAYSIVKQIKKLQPSCKIIPKKKRALLKIESPVMPQSNLCNMIIIDTAANYFKHHHEWNKDWDTGTDYEQYNQTMKDALSIHMSGHDLTSNMHRALSALSIDTHKAFSIPMIVHEWRERLAKKICHSLEVPVEKIE